MSREPEVARTLSERERGDLAPFLEAYQRAESDLRLATDQLARVLRLMEPGTADGTLRFDVERAAFVRVGGEDVEGGADG